jgi:23S rRNA (cytosine1962-C5)-methyltransferase
MQTRSEYELIDFGGGARLERFAGHTVDRPHPVALGARRAEARWADADLRFDRERGWTGAVIGDAAWSIVPSDGLAMELRPTDAGQVGLFPEHLAMVPWLGSRAASLSHPSVLHLFAYTGLATLALAAEGAAVSHVDSARPTVAWAHRNAERSGLGDRPIRWIVDDALAFTEREARRGRRYAGLVLDPPSYGHGPGGRTWRLETDLATLLEAAARLLEPGGFVLLTAHTPGVDGDRLAAELSAAWRRPGRTIERGDLAISTAEGRRLELGAFARWPAEA